MKVPLAVVIFALATGTSPALPIREALEQIETGATSPLRSAADLLVGSNGEVSRFQILPSVWHEITDSIDYHDPELAWSVAEQILEGRKEQFRLATGREPDAFDLYVIWNAPGRYSRCGYARDKIHWLIRSRAERFANLVEAE
jgi:hypothetical protein